MTSLDLQLESLITRSKSGVILDQAGAKQLSWQGPRQPDLVQLARLGPDIRTAAPSTALGAEVAHWLEGDQVAVLQRLHTTGGRLFELLATGRKVQLRSYATSPSATMVHDIKNRLNNIKVSVELARVYLKSDKLDRLQEALDSVVEEVDVATEEIARRSDKRKQQREPIDVVGILESLVESDGAHQVTLRIAADGCNLSADNCHHVARLLSRLAKRCGWCYKMESAADSINGDCLEISVENITNVEEAAEELVDEWNQPKRQLSMIEIGDEIGFTVVVRQQDLSMTLNRRGDI